MRRYWLIFVVAMLFATVASAQVTVIGEKEENEKGDDVEFARCCREAIMSPLTVKQNVTLTERPHELMICNSAKER